MSARYSLEHFLWAQIKTHNLVGRRAVISVSGGADSMAMARAWREVRPAAEISWVHVHHGTGGSPGYRDQAKTFVQDQANSLGVKLYAIDMEASSQSEASLRKARREAWRKVLDQEGPNAVLVTGHHLQDLLETRLIRLIRGAGPYGFTSFSERKGRLFRPFLQKNFVELRAYLEERSQLWIDDPSNFEQSPLRNWIRHHWLNELEKKRRGSVASLARSLELLACEISHEEGSSGSAAEQVEMRYEDYFAKSALQRRQWIASVFQRICRIEFQGNHIREVEKRLQRNVAPQAFQTGDLLWTFGRDTVHAQRVLVVGPNEIVEL